MGKIWVEVSLVSAHGLEHSSLLWKRQWFAVAWIDPNCKYCTKVDASGSENPVWKTKFVILVDDFESEINIQDLMLNVEVHSIDPVFLTEKIHGSAHVIIKEFLTKKFPIVEVTLRPGKEEVWSYPLRKKDSDKPRGFIDISIRVLEEKEEQNSNTVVNWRGKKTTGNEAEKYSKHVPLVSPHHQKKEARTNIPCSYPMQFPTNDSDADLDEGLPNYERRRTPSPPPPPSNVGYIPTFLPKNDFMPTPSSATNPPKKLPSGLAMGALIFGDDFMSGFDVPPTFAYDTIAPPPDHPT